MPYTTASVAPEPFKDLNITPFIDVLLVLLPDPMASYDKSAKTIALIKDSGSKKCAFDRLHEYRKFGKAKYLR